MHKKNSPSKEEMTKFQKVECYVDDLEFYLRTFTILFLFYCFAFGFPEWFWIPHEFTKWQGILDFLPKV